MGDFTVQSQRYQIINGVKLPPDYPNVWSIENFRSALSYKAKPNDRFIATYPKSGTTWTQQMIYLLLNNGKPQNDSDDFNATMPFFESEGSNCVSKLRSNGVLKTHLPFNVCPFHPKAKYLIILRNPKDVCVSFYFHIKNSISYHLNFNDIHEYFNYWINGELVYGNYFDHVLSWWGCKDYDNVTVLIYEDMLKDKRKALFHVATFMGDDFVKKLSDDESMVKCILDFSTVNYMKNDMKMEKKYIRKGLSGDWRNHLNENESKIIDENLKRFTGTGLEMLWSDQLEYY